MAGSVNKAIIIGRVGKDPEVRNFNGGGKLVTFSIATDKSWKDRESGEKKQQVQWHNIAVWDTKLADLTEKYVTKGMRLYIEGEIETRKWQAKDGTDRYTTEICLRPFNSTMTMLEARRDAPAQDDSFGSPRKSARTDQKGNPLPPQDDLNDDIPF